MYICTYVHPELMGMFDRWGTVFFTARGERMEITDSRYEFQKTSVNLFFFFSISDAKFMMCVVDFTYVCYI